LPDYNPVFSDIKCRCAEHRLAFDIGKNHKKYAFYFVLYPNCCIFAL